MKITHLAQLAWILMIGTLFAVPLVENNTRKIIYEKSSTQSTVEKTINELQAVGKSVLNTLEQELDEQHKQLLSKLQEIFATQEAWDEVLAELETLKNQDILLTNNPQINHSPTDHPLITKARKLMAQRGINPDVITINLIDNPKRITSAAAGQGYDGEMLIHDLEINLAQMGKLSDEEQNAVILHELIHLLKYDGLEQAAIEAMFERSEISPEVYSKHPAYSAYCRLQEYRADLLASTNLVAAFATLKNLETLMKEYPEICKKDSRRHPSIEKRHDAVDNLINYLKAEQQTITA
jgi:Zn-dependent protease with chaperone function